MQIYKEDNTQKFRNDPFSITDARACFALDPLWKTGHSTFTPFPTAEMKSEL